MEVVIWKTKVWMFTGHSWVTQKISRISKTLQKIYLKIQKIKFWTTALLKKKKIKIMLGESPSIYYYVYIIYE